MPTLYNSLRIAIPPKILKLCDVRPNLNYTLDIISLRVKSDTFSTLRRNVLSTVNLLLCNNRIYQLLLLYSCILILCFVT